MALALRFAEEGEFSSRACDTLSYDAPDVVPSKAFFRWSRPVRQELGPRADAPIRTKMLVIAMPGAAQQFVHHVTTTWSPVGTLVTSDQVIHPCKLEPGSRSNGAVILSRTQEAVAETNNTLALILSAQVPVATTWVWLNALLQHINADEMVCLDSQVSTIYADPASHEEVGAQLRMLATSSVPNEIHLKTPVPSLPVPQFVTGIPAALLTHGEVRKRRVRVFLSFRDVSCTAIDVMRSFLPLTGSVLQDFDPLRPFKPTARSLSPLNVLYT